MSVIDSLELQVKTNQKSAKSGIDSLARSLEKLKKATSGSFGANKLTQSLEKISESTRGLNANGIKKLGELATAVKSLTSLNKKDSLSGLAEGIHKVSEAANNITQESIDKLTALSQAAENLKGFRMPNMGGSRESSGKTATESTGTNNDSTTEKMKEKEGLFSRLRSEGERFAESQDKGISLMTYRLNTFLQDMQYVKAQWAPVGAAFDAVKQKIIGFFGSNPFASFKNALAGVGQQLYVLPVHILKELAVAPIRVGKAFVQAVPKVVEFGKALASAVATKVSAGIKKIGEGIKSLKNHSKTATGFLGKLFQSIKRIAFYRAIRFFFSTLTQAMKEGIKNVYAYSNAIGGTFAKSMDTLATDFLYLKNSLGAMVSPIINAIAPAVDFLTDKFVALLNVVNQFFARLTGASVWTKAKKTATSYGDAVGSAGSAASKAAKEIKDATIGIDELNIISQDDPTGSGSGSGGASAAQNYGDMFEEVAIDSQISGFVDRIKEAFADSDWKKVGEIIGGKFNEIIDDIEWDKIGSKVGSNLDSSIKITYWTLKNVNFSNLGTSVAEFVNNALDKIDFSFVGGVFARGITGVLDTIGSFFMNLDWGLVAKSVSDFLIGAFNEFTEWFQGIDWRKAGDNLYESIKSFFINFDWAGVTSSFSEFLGSAIGAAAAFLDEFISDLINDIAAYFAKYIEDENGDGKWGAGEIITGVLKGIGDAVVGIGKWIDENVVKPFVKGFKESFGLEDGEDSEMGKIGKKLIDGLLDGLNSMMESLKKWCADLPENMIKWMFGTEEDGILGKLRGLVGGSIGGLFSAAEEESDKPENKRKVTHAAKNFVNAFEKPDSEKLSSKFSGIGSSVVSAFSTALGEQSTKSETRGEIKNWSNDVPTLFEKPDSETLSTKFVNIASRVTNAFAKGVETGSNSSANTDKVKNWSKKTSSLFAKPDNEELKTKFEKTAKNVMSSFSGTVEKGYVNASAPMSTFSAKAMDNFNHPWGAWANFEGTMKSVGSSATSGFSQGVSTTYSDAASPMSTFAGNAMDRFNHPWGAWATFEGTMTAVGKSATNGFKTGVDTTYSDAGQPMSTFGGNVVDRFNYPYGRPYGTMQTLFEGIGENAVQGFDKGQTSTGLVQTALQNVANFGQSVINKIKEKLGIHSPSTVFADIGGNTLRGFDNAVKAGTPETVRIMDAWANKITAVNPTVGFAVDTSALNYYDTSKMARQMSASVSAQGSISVSGFESDMRAFYRDEVIPLLRKIEDDARRQASKDERTVVKVNGRELLSAMDAQRKANGYSFTS